MNTIFIYDTGGYCSTLVHEKLSHIVQDKNLALQISSITAQQIKDGRLLDASSVGFVMPGRNKGQDYRDELGQQGFMAIRKATQAGVNSLLICAGSATSAFQTIWDNELEPDNKKHVINPAALFEGVAIGPLSNLWKNGYHSPKQNIYHSDVLNAKVVSVTFTSALTRSNAIAGAALYWGGCALIPTANNTQSVQVLVYYQDFLDAPAVIEFRNGKGKVIASGIHPEVDAQKFKMMFAPTQRARQNWDAFQQDKAALEASAPQQMDIFVRLLENCLSEKTISPLRQPVAKAILTP